MNTVLSAIQLMKSILKLFLKTIRNIKILTLISHGYFFIIFLNCSGFCHTHVVIFNSDIFKYHVR